MRHITENTSAIMPRISYIYWWLRNFYNRANAFLKVLCRLSKRTASSLADQLYTMRGRAGRRYFMFNDA